MASALQERLTDYRFAATALGWHPGFGVACSVEGWYSPEWEPYWDLAPHRDFLAFTRDPSLIATGLGGVRLICDDPINPQFQGRSVYSAALHAIRDLDWSSDKSHAVIVYSANPACAEYQTGDPDCDTEKVSGYTSDSVISAANAENISVFLLNAGYGSYEARMRGPFQAIAEQTGGWYTEENSDVWPMLTALETAFDAVADKFVSPPPVP